MRELWDCIVVGAGPAGLSAAIYMGRFRRTTLVVDDDDGRWSYGQHNENYLGFPKGVSARRLHALGRAQAERFGVRFARDRVTQVSPVPEGYALSLRGGATDLAPKLTTTELTTPELGTLLLRSRTVIWAAGVQDHWPTFAGARRLVGKRLFWCIVCDGWRTRQQRIVIFADQTDCASTILQFLTYTHAITVVTEKNSALAGARLELEKEGVTVLTGTVRTVRAPKDAPLELRLEDGQRLEADYLFSLLGSTPKTDALATLDLKRSAAGHICIDDKNHTSLPAFFAAGDVSDKHSHQVVSAAHEGAMAAQAANHVLYDLSP